MRTKLASAIAAISCAAATLAAPAYADGRWIAVTVSVGSHHQVFTVGPDQQSAVAGGMTHCRAEYPDCQAIIAGPQCVAEVHAAGQYWGGVGPTEQDAEQNALASAGKPDLPGRADCVTNH